MRPHPTIRMWQGQQPKRNRVGALHRGTIITPYLAAFLCLVAVFMSELLAARQQSSDSPTPPASSSARLSKQSRMDLLRALDGELAYARVPFPMGKTGLKLEKGAILPPRAEVEQTIAAHGSAAKPGDLVHITEMVFRDHSIVFEINGGPIKSQKWYERIEVGGSSGPTRPIKKPSDRGATGQGSFVELIFDRPLPEMTAEQLKKLLEPVLDFNSKSAAEAYLETASPKVKEALKNHTVLVGMSRDMVLAAKGIPRQRIEETENDVEYEEWIYGEPPHEVSFIRFLHDEVARVETITVDGKKSIKTDKEIDIHAGEGTKQGNEADPPASPPR